MAHDPVALGKGVMRLMPYKCDHPGLSDSPEFLTCRPIVTLCKLQAGPWPGAQAIAFGPGAVSGDAALSKGEQARWESASTGPRHGSVLTRGQGAEAHFISVLPLVEGVRVLFFLFFFLQVGCRVL